MDVLGELLFGRLRDSTAVILAALRILGVLLMCAALWLLGRRNEVGWWLATGAFLLPGLAELFIPRGYSTSSLPVLMVHVAGNVLVLVLTAGVGVYGLLSFRKLPLTAPSTRAITLPKFRASHILAPLILAIVYAAASLLMIGALFMARTPSSPFPVGTLLLSGVITGLLPAGLLALAHRSHWAWFLIVAASLISIVGTTATAQGSVLIFLYLLQAVLAVYGWARWGAIPSRAVPSSPTPVKPTF